MTYDAKLKQSLEDLGLHIEPGLDTSAGDEYCAYGYTSAGALFGDDAPCLDCRKWTVCYVAPIGYNRLEMRQRIRMAILGVFGVWPTEEDATDASGQRYLYDFETIGAIDDGKA